MFPLPLPLCLTLPLSLSPSLHAVSPDVRGAYFGSLDKAFEGFTYVGNAGSRYMMDGGGGGSSYVGSHGGRRYARRIWLVCDWCVICRKSCGLCVGVPSASAV
jgi:hypothetical protein